MRKKWERHDTESPVPAPPLPEPPEPKVADPKDDPSNDNLPFDEVVPVPDTPTPPVPLLPSFEGEDPKITVAPKLPADPINVRPPKHLGKEIAFEYYGSLCRIPFNSPVRVTLNGVDENSVADAWNLLTCEETVDLVKYCIDLRDNICLPDWGYLRLVENLSNTICQQDRNASTLLQMFLLTQSGYKVRIGRKDNHLVILMPSNETIYNYVYVTKNGINYYVIDSSNNTEPIYVFDQEFPREQQFSLAMIQQPKLTVNPAGSNNFSIKYPADASADVAVNKNLIDFYNDYPLNSHWNIYANASLSQEVKAQLYPELEKILEGKRVSEAANILLHFVQKAFQYKTDHEQFGVERSLFPDETFYYPYSDCEDRAILYSVLVRELLGLDVVLVHYPNHIATAVAFDESVNGDYFEINGRRFTVCDPTYINANIGMAMPQLKSTPATLIDL